MYFQNVCKEHNTSFNALGSYCPICMRQERITELQKEIKENINIIVRFQKEIKEMGF